MNLSRRDLLKVGLFSSAALMLPAERIARTQLALTNRLPQSLLPQPFTVPFATPPVLAPAYETPSVAYYDIVQRQAKAEILPGLETTIWGYNGIAPGPTVVTKQGQKVVMRQANELPAVHPTQRYNVWTSTHLHGSCSLPQYDGYASDITRPNQYKDYHYPQSQDARTLWYHDHGVHITAFNAYMGLAGMYVMHDPIEGELGIPRGRYDVPFILRDAMFQKNGDLVIDDNGESGIYGDVILVNGKPWPLMQVESRKYRFRILNAAVSRSFDLRLDNGEPMTVIATDGGLMPLAQETTSLRVSMAERYEVVIDFAKYRPGERIVMRNVSPKNNIDFDTTEVVMAFEVGATVTDSTANEVPEVLNPNEEVMGLKESDAVRTRNLRFERGQGQWTINDHVWSDIVNSGYELVVANPGLDDVEIWELENKSGGWFHPVHIHMVDFKILDRNGRPPEPYEQGPKDVVYVGEDELVRVIMRFDHPGKYMIHCHNLVHEDHDMMTQFRVGPDDGRNDPIEADPCKDRPYLPLFEREDEDDDSDKGHGSDDDHVSSGEDRSGGGSLRGSAPTTSSGSKPAAGKPARRKRKKVRRKVSKPQKRAATKPKPKRTGEARPKARRRRRSTRRGRSS